jgi:phosphoribosylaminoimidazolecarboxamide formyltransferase/IMP cyclohydrolase
LIRATAKNYQDVTVVPSRNEYGDLLTILKEQDGKITLDQRKALARKAFAVSSHYDTAIFNYFNQDGSEEQFKQSIPTSSTLRYGENPHQAGTFFGELEAIFDILGGKALSYNNLVDVDAAVSIMRELVDGDPAVAILKHTNACGVAVRSTLAEAWKDALAGDPRLSFWRHPHCQPFH